MANGAAYTASEITAVPVQRWIATGLPKWHAVHYLMR